MSINDTPQLPSLQPRIKHCNPHTFPRMTVLPQHIRSKSLCRGHPVLVAEKEFAACGRGRPVAAATVVFALLAVDIENPARFEAGNDEAMFG
jgi:hypothetical protein